MRNFPPNIWAGFRLHHLTLTALVISILCLAGCTVEPTPADPSAAPTTTAPQQPPTAEFTRQVQPYRNLIVIMIDTLRADHLPEYGYGRQTAPFLSQLGREGLVLPSSAASSWTRPSITTLFSGLPPQTHQTISRTDSLADDLPYLPELLSVNGFATAAYIGNLNVGRRWGFDRGFDRFHQTSPSGKAKARVAVDVSLSLADELAQKLADRSRERFFLYSHLVDPHDPYRPETPFKDSSSSPSSDLAEPSQHTWFQPRRLIREKTPLTPAVLQSLRDQYDGEIFEMDQELRRLFEGLQSRELLSETLVVVTSDHGEEFGEHGGLTHGRTLYREVLEVPLIIWSERLADRTNPNDSQLHVHQIDLMPSILDSLGLQIPEGLTASLWPTLLEDTTSPQGQEKSSLTPQGQPDRFYHLDLEGQGWLAVVAKDSQLAWRNGQWIQDPWKEGAKEVRPEPEVLSQLRHKLQTHHSEALKRSLQRQKTSLDAETREGLQLLGYLDEATTETQLQQRTLPEVLTPKE